VPGYVVGIVLFAIVTGAFIGLVANSISLTSSGRDPGARRRILIGAAIPALLIVGAFIALALST
jgi:hypothetical protein